MINTKYKVLYQKLRKRLGALSPGDKLPAVRVLQAEYQVSLATLNSALKLLADDGYIELVPYKGIYKSVSNQIANNFRKTVTLLLPGRNETLFIKIISSCHQALCSRGCKLNLVVYDLTSEAECKQLGNQLQDDAAGVIYMPTSETPQAVELLGQLNAIKPVVQIDREIGDGITSAIGYEQFSSSYLATELLIKSGCRRIGLVGPMDRLSSQRERIAGFEAALRDHGMAPDPDCDIIYDYQNLNISTDLNELLASKFRPDGLFGTNSVFMPRLFQKFAQLGIRVPDDIAVTVFDLGETMSSLPLKMTYVDEATGEVVERAVELLLQEIDSGERCIYREFLPCPLVCGNSCEVIDKEMKPVHSRAIEYV